MATTAFTGSALHAFIATRREKDEPLYAVADAARDRDLALAARDRFGLPALSLFTRATIRDMDKVAPYLVSMNLGPRYPYPDSGYLDLWAAKLGTSSGILLLTDADADKLWAHLRTVFRITDEEGGKFYFRFYDPRVLRVFLPTCTAAEAREFFGPIRTILVEGERAGQLLVCQPGHRGVRVIEAALSRPAQEARAT
jgi:hypothetical protein